MKAPEVPEYLPMFHLMADICKHVDVHSMRAEYNTGYIERLSSFARWVMEIAEEADPHKSPDEYFEKEFEAMAKHTDFLSRHSKIKPTDE